MPLQVLIDGVPYVPARKPRPRSCVDPIGVQINEARQREAYTLDQLARGARMEDDRRTRRRKRWQRREAKTNA